MTKVIINFVLKVKIHIVKSKIMFKNVALIVEISYKVISFLLAEIVPFGRLIQKLWKNDKA